MNKLGLGSFDFSSEILCTDWLLLGFCLLFPGFDFCVLKDPLLLQALAICPTFDMLHLAVLNLQS